MGIESCINHKYPSNKTPESQASGANGEDPFKSEKTKIREFIEKFLLLLNLREGYEKLPEENRKYNGKVISFDDILIAIPDLSHLLLEMATLKEPTIYFLSDDGRLVFGDGCKELPPETIGINYNFSRYRETSISYRFDKGKIITVRGNDLWIPKGVQIITDRGLPTTDEYNRMNCDGRFENDTTNKSTWIEGGLRPKIAHVGYWRGNSITYARGYENSLKDVPGHIGTRRVLRVPLNFELK